MAKQKKTPPPKKSKQAAAPEADAAQPEEEDMKGLAKVIVRNEFGLNQDRIIEQIDEVVDTTQLPEEMERPLVQFPIVF